MRCDESFIALPLLSALAAAIGNTRRLKVKKVWSAPAILWTCVVGESSSVKSPARDLALAPVNAAQTRALKRYDADLAAYETEIEEWESEQRQRRGKRKSDHKPPPKPTEPIPVRYFADDITIEALACRLQDQPRGLLVKPDELAAWLESHNAYKGGRGGDTKRWLSMFDGRELMVDRKLHKRPISVPHASVSICGGVPPAVLARVLGDEHFDDGLAPRFLYSFPTPPPKIWTEADVDRDTERAVESIFGALYALQFDFDDEGERRPKLLTFTPSGKRAWIDFYNAHNEAAASLSGHLNSAAGKLEGYVPRLALVLHCVRQAAGELSDDAQVDEASVDAAATLVRWFLREFVRVYRVLRESPVDAEHRRLAEWIAARGGEITVRQAQQGRRDLSTTDEAKAALDALAEAGYGEWQRRQPAAGPPTRVFCVSTPSTVYGLSAKPEKNIEPVDSRHVDECFLAHCGEGAE